MITKRYGFIGIFKRDDSPYKIWAAIHADAQKIILQKSIFLYFLCAHPDSTNII